jgi:hypothetical protein
MDPLARMQLHSDSFRAMTEQVQQAADRLCGGKLVMVHEGGYAESYVPFCGLAVMEAERYPTEVGSIYSAAAEVPGGSIGWRFGVSLTLFSRDSQLAGLLEN